MEQVEITLSEGVAGTTFAYAKGAVLIVGQAIHQDEARRWVNGGRAAVTKGTLPGVQPRDHPAAMVGVPPVVVEEEPETLTVRRKRS